MSVKYIITIDPSMRGTGLAVFDNTGRCLKTHCIRTKEGLPDHTTVDIIVAEFYEFIAPYLTNDALVNKTLVFFIEDITEVGRGFSSKKGGGGQKSAKNSARAKVSGVLEWNLRQDGFKVYGVHPGALWTFLQAKYGVRAGRVNSKEKKQITMNLLHKHENFFTTNDNEADAYALGLYGFAFIFLKMRLAVRALFAA